MLQENLGDIVKYYPDYAQVHQENISALIGIAPDNIVVANGVTEIITLLCRDSEGPILTSTPTFGRWTDLPPDFGVPLRFINREKANQFRLEVDQIVARVRETDAKTLVICNPNNPTGAWLSAAEIKRLLHSLQHLPRIIIDESFIEFSDLESADKLAIESDNTIVVKSMGKTLGWHGIRLGYGVANKQMAQALRVKVPYWNINGVAAFVLKNIVKFREAYVDSFGKVGQDREYMLAQLRTIAGLTTYPSKANFLFSELPPAVSGKQLRDILLEEYGLIIRECSNKIGSTETYLRNVVRRKEDIDKLVSALGQVLPELIQSSVAVTRRVIGGSEARAHVIRTRSPEVA